MLWYNIMSVIVGVGFTVVIGLIAVQLIRGGVQWNINNNSPVLTVAAKLVAKRTKVDSHVHTHGTEVATHHFSNSTIYYVTFEVDSGDRIELKVPGGEFGVLVEGDTGRLTFQGTRYKGFDRNKA